MPDTSEQAHAAFTRSYYERSKSSMDPRSIVSAYGDAAHMCDNIAADIRKEHTINRGWKAGQVSDLGEAMAKAVIRAGDAIWKMREIHQPPREAGDE